MKKICLLIMLMSSMPSFATVYYVSDGFFGSKTFQGNDQLIMTGGGGLSTTGKDFSVLDIKNTTPYVAGAGGIGTLDLGASSRLFFSGGELNGFYISGNATAIFSGGRINRIYSYQPAAVPNYQPGPHIEMKVKDYLPSGNILTGHWANNTAFSIQLMNQAGYNPVIDNIKFTIIPEPMTLALLALGGLLICRK